MSNNELHARAVEAAISFVKRNGMSDIRKLDGEPLNFCAIDKEENTVVFFAVKVSENGFGGIINERRQEAEMQAAFAMGEMDLEGDVAVRFDEIEMIVVNGNRALLRHHINALNEA